MDGNAQELTATEVLVFDSSTFIEEAGLTSHDAAALRHYLYERRTQLVVPDVVVEECDQNLSKRANGKVKSVQDSLRWLGRFCGQVNGWNPPEPSEMAERQMAVARGEAFNAVVISETSALRQRAEERRRAQRPPSHKRDSLGDCRVWEQCLELLGRGDVILVSGDGDFCGHGHPGRLHPQLRDEAEAVSGGNLIFHSDMASLLAGLRAEIPRLPEEDVLAFVYDTIGAEVAELEANSGGFRPTREGTVEQQLFTTDSANVVEVRLKVNDLWRLDDTEQTLPFRLSGTCRYRLADYELCDLKVANIGLYETQPDGSERAVKGSAVFLSASLYAGARPIRPDPAEVRSETTFARREAIKAVRASAAAKRAEGSSAARSQDFLYGETESKE